MTKSKLKKELKKIGKAIYQDVSYNYGGWLFLLGRLSWNAFILFYMMQFIKGLLIYVFKAQDILITEEHYRIISIIVWASGALYLTYRISYWRQPT